MTGGVHGGIAVSVPIQVTSFTLVKSAWVSSVLLLDDTIKLILLLASSFLK